MDLCHGVSIPVILRCNAGDGSGDDVRRSER